MPAQWSSTELLYGLVVWAILVSLVTNLVGVVGVVPRSTPIVPLLSLLPKTLLFVIATEAVWALRDEMDSATSDEVFRIGHALGPSSKRWIGTVWYSDT